MYCVFATITPKPEYFAAAKDAILSILAETRQEAGCVQFDIHTDDEAIQIFLYEQWRDEAALQHHYQQAYTQAVFDEYIEWLAKPVEIVKCNLVDH